MGGVFQYAGEPTYRETVNKVIASKEELQKAGELLMSISQDERERAVFRSRRMYQTDLQSDLATAEDRGERRGRAEGLAEGRAEGFLASIRSLMANTGWPLEKAMEILGVPDTDRSKYADLLQKQ